MKPADQVAEVKKGNRSNLTLRILYNRRNMKAHDYHCRLADYNDNEAKRQTYETHSVSVSTQISGSQTLSGYHPFDSQATFLKLSKTSFAQLVLMLLAAPFSFNAPLNLSIFPQEAVSSIWEPVI